MVRVAATLMLPAAETRTSRKHPSFSRQLSSVLSDSLRLAFCTSSNEATSPAMVRSNSITVATTGTITSPEASGAKGGLRGGGGEGGGVGGGEGGGGKGGGEGGGG